MTRAAVAAVTFMAALAGAAARDDSGVHDFFATQGRDSAPAASVEVRPAAAPTSARRFDRASAPLTVRMRRPRGETMQIAERSRPEPGKVTIYEDTTLRRGDAVMTTKGIRVFAGSRSFPYRDGDFVALADAGRIDARVQKALAELDRLPPG